MERAPAVRGEVHRRRPEPGVREGLEHRHGARAEMLRVHPYQGVAQRSAETGGACGAERRAVLHEAALAAVPPHEVGDLVDVRMRPRRDRGEADGGQGGERRRRAPEASPPGQRRQRRQRAVGERRLEHLRREPVDDDEDELRPRRRGHFASERSPAWRAGSCRALRTAATGTSTASR